MRFPGRLTRSRGRVQYDLVFAARFFRARVLSDSKKRASRTNKGEVERRKAQVVGRVTQTSVAASLASVAARSEPCITGPEYLTEDAAQTRLPGMIWQLTIDSTPPHLRHGERLKLGGGVGSYRWDDFSGGPPEPHPDLTRCSMHWDMFEDRSAFEEYSECVRNWGVSPSNRGGELAQRWADAKGFLMVDRDNHLWIALLKPPSPSFDNFMIANIIANNRLFFTIKHLHFVERDDVPAAPVTGFLRRSEPAFFNDWADFQFCPSGTVDDGRQGETILRHGRRWLVPPAAPPKAD